MNNNLFIIHTEVEQVPQGNWKKWIDYITGFNEWADKWKAYHTNYAKLHKQGGVPTSTLEDESPKA